MPFVAILGAGPLGGALTYTLACRARFDEVRLIDPAGTVAAGKALDIRQAGPPDGFSTRVSGHAALDAAAGAWVLVLADPLSRDDAAPDLLAMVRAAAAAAPGAVLVCAEAGSAPLLPRLVGAGAIAPDLLIGSAPSAVAGAARALIAAACDRSAAEVLVSLAAEPTQPSALVIDWTRTAIAGSPAADLLPREQRARLDAHLARSWPPGPLALASSAARTAESAWFGSRSSSPAWVVDRSLPGPPTSTEAPGGARLLEVRYAPGGRLHVAAQTAPR